MLSSCAPSPFLCVRHAGDLYGSGPAATAPGVWTFVCSLLSLHLSPPNLLQGPLLQQFCFPSCLGAPFTPSAESAASHFMWNIFCCQSERFSSLLHLFSFSHILYPGIKLSFAMKLPDFTRNSGHQQKNNSNVIPHTGCSNTSKAEDPSCFFGRGLFFFFFCNCTAKQITLVIYILYTSATVQAKFKTNMHMWKTGRVRLTDGFPATKKKILLSKQMKREKSFRINYSVHAPQTDWPESWVLLRLQHILGKKAAKISMLCLRKKYSLVWFSCKLFCQ